MAQQNNSWTCGECTYDNHEDLPTCEVCGLPRVAAEGDRARVLAAQALHLERAPERSAERGRAPAEEAAVAPAAAAQVVAEAAAPVSAEAGPSGAGAQEWDAAVEMAVPETAPETPSTDAGHTVAAPAGGSAKWALLGP
jgi:hypothetical protein